MLELHRSYLTGYPNTTYMRRERMSMFDRYKGDQLLSSLNYFFPFWYMNLEFTYINMSIVMSRGAIIFTH